MYYVGYFLLVNLKRIKWLGAFNLYYLTKRLRGMGKLKLRLITEIIIALLLSILIKIVINQIESLLKLDSLWFGVLTYIGYSSNIALCY